MLNRIECFCEFIYNSINTAPSILTNSTVRPSKAPRTFTQIQRPLYWLYSPAQRSPAHIHTNTSQYSALYTYWLYSPAQQSPAHIHTNTAPSVFTDSTIRPSKAPRTFTQIPVIQRPLYLLTLQSGPAKPRAHSHKYQLYSALCTYWLYSPAQQSPAHIHTNTS